MPPPGPVVALGGGGNALAKLGYIGGLTIWLVGVNRFVNITDNPEEKRLAPAAEPFWPFADMTGDDGLVFGRFKIVGLLRDEGDTVLYRAVEVANRGRVTLVSPATADSKTQEAFASFYASSTFDHENIFRPLEILRSVGSGGQAVLLNNYSGFVRLSEIVSATGAIDQESQIAELLLQLCRGLKCAHEAGVAHGALGVDNVLLGNSADDQVRLLIDGFKWTPPKNTASKERLESQKRFDIFGAGLLAFYLVTGTMPQDASSIDLGAMSKFRPDFHCMDELVWLLEDVLSTDELSQIKSIEEFENGILDWLESLRSVVAADLAGASGGSDLVSEGRVDTPTTKDLSSAIQHITDLRRKQSDQEESMVIKLTDLASTGARRSPTRTLTRVLAVGSVLFLIGSGFVYLYSNEPAVFHEGFSGISRQFYAVVHPGSDEAENIDSSDLASQHYDAGSSKINSASVKGHHGTVGSAAVKIEKVSNDLRGRKNRVRAFDAALLRDIYRGKGSGANNGEGKNNRFRIEYREFKSEWIK